MTLAYHKSESGERYTPPAIVERAKTLLGRIDLDPASCKQANKVVGAEAFLTAEDKPLARPWHGTVFLNPPGSCQNSEGFVGCGSITRSGKRRTTCGCRLVHRFWGKLVREVDRGNVTRALWVGFNTSQLQALQSEPFSPLSFPTCFPSKRLQYLNPETLAPMASPPHASYLTMVTAYMGDLDRFRDAFGDLGIITRCVS